MRSRAASSSDSTYAVEPSRPSSSAPQKAKRIWFSRLLDRFAWIAISSVVAEPVPLSLMPGPSLTESR